MQRILIISFLLLIMRLIPLKELELTGSPVAVNETFERESPRYAYWGYCSLINRPTRIVIIIFL